MTPAILSVLSCGPQVTVQDGGRPGFLRFGVPASGPLDRLSHAAANVALGNPPGAAAIEVSLGGLALRCDQGRVSFALAGGGFVLEHAGQRSGAWFVATLDAGQTLVIRPGRWGSWCYLAFAGQVQAQDWLGSRASHALSGMGGARLAPGGCLTIADPAERPDREGPITCPVLARPRHAVHVTLGPQDGHFPPEAVAALRSGAWSMTGAWDRMGVRLKGPPIAPRAIDMPSAPILRGAVQVAGDGVATVLLADHQPTGGYPRIATVLDCDLDAMMQLRPNDAIAFVPVPAARAIALARSQARAVAAYMQGLAIAHGGPTVR